MRKIAEQKRLDEENEVENQAMINEALKLTAKQRRESLRLHEKASRREAFEKRFQKKYSIASLSSSSDSDEFSRS